MYRPKEAEQKFDRQRIPTVVEKKGDWPRRIISMGDRGGWR